MECPNHGVKQAEVSWAEPGSRSTQSFERFAIDVSQGTDTQGAGRILRLSWDGARGSPGEGGVEEEGPRAPTRFPDEPALLGPASPTMRKGSSRLSLDRPDGRSGRHRSQMGHAPSRPERAPTSGRIYPQRARCSSLRVPGRHGSGRRLRFRAIK